MRLQILIYKSLCIVAGLLMMQCPGGFEYQYVAYNCSMEIHNDTDYPVTLHLNFDPQSGRLYTFGEVRYIIDVDSRPYYNILYIVEDRYMERTKMHPFQAIWKTPNDEIVYCKLYRLNPNTYEEEELLGEWEDPQKWEKVGYSREPDFFNSCTWRIHESEFDETTWTYKGELELSKLLYSKSVLQE